jgi:hypothetical protein
MLDYNPTLTVAQIRQALEQTARPIHLRFTSARPTITFPIDELFPVDPDGYDFDSGYGLVDAAAALDVVSGP